jgi:hypothetical protein
MPYIIWDFLTLFYCDVMRKETWLPELKNYLGVLRMVAMNQKLSHASRKRSGYGSRIV